MNARNAIHIALTCDYGSGARDAAQEAETVVDLNGLLRIDHVDRFVAALIAWKSHVTSRRAERKGAKAARDKVRAVIEKHRRTA